ncbi:MAG TPA: excinuclease ABC subunit UvrC [Candidatus Acidoferrum sp.]|nr:excinuclease ABC subunit UvrC [Candidatus Acidoferrum sp.]
MPATEKIRQKIGDLPHKPGVYLMKDRFGTVIYVGKARDLRKRVSTYFHPSRRMGWDLKLNALVEAVHDLDTWTVRSEPEALLLEGKLIKEYQPRYNISFRDDKRFLLIKINLNDPIPRFMLTRLRQDDGARYFGPFAHSASARHTLTLARRKFNLRGCRPLTPGEEDYKHCLYGHLKYCTAPCIGNVSREDYRLQARAACDFLDGQTGEIERDLEEQMKKAAAAEDFEKAAQFRDALEDLRRTVQKTRKFPRLPYNLPVAIEPQEDVAELAKVLGLPAHPVRIEGFDISNISGTFAVASMVSFRNGRPDRSNYRRYRIKTVAGQDDFACMAETVRRRYARLLAEGAPKAGEGGAGGEAGKENRGTAAVSPASLAKRSAMHPKDDVVWREDSVGETPTDATGTVALPGKSLMIGAVALPDLILIDGGKGQLNAAVAELAALGLERIPVIGLAKEFEEVFRPGESAPMRLSHDSGALKLLQRVRDESHRFANTYNAQLRLKRISESILDEFPGIGGRRKAALLKKFGSVQRLRLASVEQITQVAGFGGKTAEELKKFLEAHSPSGTK